MTSWRLNNNDHLAKKPGLFTLSSVAWVARAVWKSSLQHKSPHTRRQALLLHEMMLIREHSSYAMRRVDHHRAPSSGPFGPNEISIFCPRALQGESNLFRYKATTSHQNRSYLNNKAKQVIILSVSSKGTAAAK